MQWKMDILSKKFKGAVYNEYLAMSRANFTATIGFSGPFLCKS